MKLHKSLVSVVLFAIMMLSSAAAFGAMSGDLDNSGKIELQDAVLGLQVTAQLRNAQDLGYTGNIGLAEVIYDLRILAGIGGGKARAMLGPLSGAIVNVYRLNDMTTAIYNTSTDSDGYFNTALLSESDFVIVAVSGGTDTDSNDDGVSGDTVQNTGTIYALMTAEQFAAGNFVVSAITDIAYQYSKNLIGQADSSWLKTRLDDLAKNFFISDLNGDGAIDSKDLLMFVPTDANHKSKLNFDYQMLFTPDENGNSIIGAYHQNLPDMLQTLLDSKFGSRISLLASTDARYQKVKVEVSVFGDGMVTSDIGGIDVDTQLEDLSYNVYYAFFDKSDTGKVILTATPTDQTQILLWTGCDKVSADNTQCECSLKDNYLVSVSFGYKETKLKDGITLVDLSNANVVLSDDLVTLYVTAGEGDTDMIAKLAALKAGDVVVSSTGVGFLRRVVSVQKQSDSSYILTTSDIALEDVIAQGTGVFNKDMTNEDLIPDNTSARSLRGYAPGFQGADGVRFIPSDNPNDPVFRFVIGDPDSKERMSKKLSWTDPKTGSGVDITGTIDASVNVDFGASFNFWECKKTCVSKLCKKWCCFNICYPVIQLKEFRFIPKLTATEKLEVNVHGKLESNNWEAKIGTLNFKPIIVWAGYVPIVITPQIEIYLGIQAKVGGQIVTSITFRQTASAGIHYTRDNGLKTPSTFSSTYDFSPPTITAYAELIPYGRIFPTLRLYGLTGPALDVKGYLKLRGDLNLSVPYSDKPCIDSLLIAAYWGVKINLAWDIGKLSVILGKIASSNPSTPIYSTESLIKKWDYCINEAPFMEVQGSDILKTVYLKSGDVVSTTYTVRNSGDTTMNWTASALSDGITSVTPTSGSLAKGQSTTVTVSVNTGNISSASAYKNTVAFRNLYTDKNTSQANNGSANRNVSVNVLPKLVAPVLNTPVIATDSNGNQIPSKVNLSWSYPDAETLGYVKGYYIYKNDSLITVLTRPDSGLQVANLSPGVTYSFQIKAYGINTAGYLSNIVSIKTACLYSISSASQSFGVSGGSGVVNVTGSVGCSWTAASNASWISITSGSSGTGNGTVSYSVAANPSTSTRTGTIMIAGKTFTITQSGISCTIKDYLWRWEPIGVGGDPDNFYLSSTGGSGSIEVSSEYGLCPWTAVSSDTSWLVITSGNSFNGNGTVSFSVAANTATSSRTGTLTVAGKTFTVTQAGITCTYSISSSSQSFSSSAGTGSVNVTAPSGCTWTAASSDTSWLNITSGNSGNGNGTVSFSVAQNSGSSRTGTLTIAGQTFTVTQSGASTIVYFPDKNLETAIRTAINKPSGDIFASDLQVLTSFSASGRSIVNSEGLQYCINLTSLTLSGNQISNISVLSDLKNLTYLDLGNNQISNITAIAGLTNLTLLWLNNNQIANISALTGLNNLVGLHIGDNQITSISVLAGLSNINALILSSNQISDISPLVSNSGIGSGDSVYLYTNPLSTTSCTVYIPQLQSRGATVQHTCP